MPPVHELSAVNGQSLRFKYSATPEPEGDIDIWRKRLLYPTNSSRNRENLVRSQPGKRSVDKSCDLLIGFGPGDRRSGKTI
jgi:hypothetical protein